MTLTERFARLSGARLYGPTALLLCLGLSGLAVAACSQDPGSGGTTGATPGTSLTGSSDGATVSTSGGVVTSDTGTIGGATGSPTQTQGVSSAGSAMSGSTSATSLGGSVDTTTTGAGTSGVSASLTGMGGAPATNTGDGVGGQSSVMGSTSAQGSTLTTGAGGSGGGQAAWLAAWATGPQLTEPANLPPDPGLSNNTLRQLVFPTFAGTRVRLRFSNEFGNGPVTFNEVHVARAAQGSATDATTDQTLFFDGVASVTIQPGEFRWSDPLDFQLDALTRVAITIAFGSVPSDVTGHPGSRTTSYLQSGQVAASANLAAAVATAHWYYITGIDVESDPDHGAVVVLGDSITDGRGSTTDGNDRWPDQLARRLHGQATPSSVSVVNQGIGGNAILSGGLGPTALERWQRDVLGQSGTRWVIVLEGVNDIGESSQSVADDLIAAYQQFISSAHDAGLLIYASPILPFGGSFYDSVEHEVDRQSVNEWIRTSGAFDAVIDLDAAVRDPSNPTRLLPAYDSGDQLHLNPTGLQAMADAVELALFGD